MLYHHKSGICGSVQSVYHRLCVFTASRVIKQVQPRLMISAVLVLKLKLVESSGFSIVHSHNLLCLQNASRV